MTAYIPFHPGGVKYIMMGAGRDATALFNKYHAWVNIDFMMAKCMVGLLESPADRAARKAAESVDPGGAQAGAQGTTGAVESPEEGGSPAQGSVQSRSASDATVMDAALEAELSEGAGATDPGGRVGFSQA